MIFCIQIRETPHKRHHKFIEFYDVRAAEAALRALNRSDIAGKRIKLEPSRPGGARRRYLHHFRFAIIARFIEDGNEFHYSLILFEWWVQQLASAAESRHRGR